MIAERDRLLEQARVQAERLVEQGREEQSRLVEATAVYTRAQAEADRMLEQATDEAEAMRLQTEDYVDAKLANFEVVLSTTLATVTRGRERLSGRSELDALDDADLAAVPPDPEAPARRAASRPAAGRPRPHRPLPLRAVFTTLRAHRAREQEAAAPPRPPSAPRPRHARAGPPTGVDAHAAAPRSRARAPRGRADRRASRRRDRPGPQARVGDGGRAGQRHGDRTPRGGVRPLPRARHRHG